MKNTYFLLLSIILTANLGATAWAAKPVIANIDLAKELGRPIIRESADLGVALIFATDKDMERLSELSHAKGQCGGFELVPDVVAEMQGSVMILSTRQIDKLFESLETAERNANRVHLHAVEHGSAPLEYDPGIDAAVQSVDANRIMEGIAWLEGFGGRYHASENPNNHVNALYDILIHMGQSSGLQHEVHLIEHRNTRQNSVLFRLVGSERPQETVVLGGHFDSINHEFFGNKNNAPGADDNASGSASLIEALEILLATGQQPQRTVEFMWYAAEEVGLVGSAEIASEYANQRRDVVGVLQLDMTLVPGSGVFTIASMSDFTSPWLRSLLLQMNEQYIHANIVDSRCGYGCSDHASWHRRGYPAIFPHEGRMNDINSQIHTPRDRIDARSSAEHTAKFAQIGVAFALVLGNSELREP